jgi:uncharacterized iron-regulated membrane protein
MEPTMSTTPFNKRAFISMGLVTAGLLLPISGYMNHILQFEPLTRERHFWMSVHNMSGIILTLFALAHVVLNRRALSGYVLRMKRTYITKEALFSCGLILILVGLFSLHTLHGG